ncbi:MAG: N-acetylglucosamine-6-phosphate deacetylase [Halanaerobium sp.]|nr:N-acetylglucosamine-6-phosphate deacetylase [Halanaerobium sp.]
MRAIRSEKIVTPDGILDGHLVLEEGKIIKVAEGELPANFDGEIIEARDRIVAPGFIDLHIHGAGGWQVLGVDEGAILNLARFLASNGVTSFYLTPGTIGKDILVSSVAKQAGAIKKQQEEPAGSGAEMLGIHLEGPFISKEEKGAMDARNILPCSLADMKELEEAAAGFLSRVTLAPELPDALEMIKYLTEKGYTVAGGHTNASYEEMMQGIEAGVRVANHMYNAMSGLHHRKPGAVGAYLTDERVSCEIIADGIHVHPKVIELTLECKGLDKVYLISDAIIAAGLPAGNYQFAGHKIEITEEGLSRLPDGTIAGSTFLMNRTFRNLLQVIGLSLEEAVQISSLNPARMAGVADRKGSISEGKDADIVIMAADYQVEYSLARGELYASPGQDPTVYLNKSI